MSKSRAYIMTRRSLKSADKYDEAETIKQATHEYFDFVIYNNSDNPTEGWTSYQVVVSHYELFEMLKKLAVVYKQGEPYEG